jgi:hypothetical protein
VRPLLAVEIDKERRAEHEDHLRFLLTVKVVGEGGTTTISHIASPVRAMITDCWQPLIPSRLAKGGRESASK